MDQYDYLTRDQLISLIRVLGTARGEGARGQAPGAADGLSEFGERALREFENSSSPMRIFDHETLKHLAVNDAAVKFYGYSREEFLAITLKDTRHPDEHDLQLASLKEASGYLRYGKPRRQLKKSGEIAVVEVVTQDILYNGRKARLTLTIDITGRLRMQELLWRRQQEFESLANNLPDLVARYDRDRRFLYANSAIERSFGLDRAQIVGRTQREIGLPEELASLYDDSLAGVFATGQPHKVEFRLALPSGERQYEACHVAEMDAAGKIGSVICVARDITDSKRSEQALRESNEFLRSVIESSRDCIKVLDLEGRLKLMNDGGRQLLEIDNLAPLLNTEWLEFWRGADQAAAGAALDAARRGGVGSLEGYCPTQKGSPRWWDVVVTPILDADGKPERLLAVSRDITRRRHTQDALREAQQRLQLVIRGGGVGLWDWNLKTGEVYFSREWKQQIGFDEHEITDRLEEWESRIHPDDRARLGDAVREFLTQPDSGYQREYRLRHRDGSYRWVLSRASAQLGADGKVERMFGCHVDVTQQKRIEEERLDYAVRQRDALVREVHHRIKNSLQGVVGLLRQKIRKYPAITPDIEECIAQLQSVALVYGLQETRPDGLLNLAEITDAICSSAGNLIGGRLERIFERESQGPACVVAREAVSVAVALNELVINALKHQPARAGKKHVRIVLRETDDEAEIRIANRGHLPAGFDYHGGRAAGNGLELVRTLLVAPGGTITFNGARGEVEVVLKLSPPLLAERQGTLRGKR